MVRVSVNIHRHGPSFCQHPQTWSEFLSTSTDMVRISVNIHRHGPSFCQHPQTWSEFLSTSTDMVRISVNIHRHGPSFCQHPQTWSEFLSTSTDMVRVSVNINRHGPYFCQHPQTWSDCRLSLQSVIMSRLPQGGPDKENMASRSHSKSVRLFSVSLAFLFNWSSSENRLIESRSQMTTRCTDYRRQHSLSSTNSRLQLKQTALVNRPLCRLFG